MNKLKLFKSFLKFRHYYLFLFHRFQSFFVSSFFCGHQCFGHICRPLDLTSGQTNLQQVVLCKPVYIYKVYRIGGLLYSGLIINRKKCLCYKIIHVNIIKMIQ